MAKAKTTRKSAPEMYEYGRKLEKLGKALQSADTRMTTLALLAFECGLDLQFRIVSAQETSASAEGGK